MSLELIPVTFHKVMQSKSYTVFILEAEGRYFPIYTEPKVGENLQMIISEKSHPRPYTHDLIHLLLQGLDAKLLQMVIYNVEDTVYFSKLFIEQKKETISEILEIDARPSDCLILALMHQIPIFCRKEVLEKAPSIELD